MLILLATLLSTLRSIFRSRAVMELENLALRVGEGFARATIYSAAGIGISGGLASGRWIAPSIRTPRCLRDAECGGERTLSLVF
jgi:hypothetical protein